MNSIVCQVETSEIKLSSELLDPTLASLSSDSGNLYLAMKDGVMTSDKTHRQRSQKFRALMSFVASSSPCFLKKRLS